MPWNKVDLMSQRQELIEKMLLPDANVSELCVDYHISEKTAYKWMKRYREEGIAGLNDQSKARHNQPQQTNHKLEKLVVQTHIDFPYWGPRKLRNYLLNQGMKKPFPSVSTFARILRRNYCVVSRNNKSKPATQRFERPAANDLWQMDFKGSFMTKQCRCYPLTVIDDHSRYCIGLQSCGNEQYLTVKEQLTAIFKRYGLPSQINVDNGNPWGSSHLDSYTQFAVWLMKQKIRLTHSAPYHPQTNGKNERFHRTLKLEVLHERSYESLADIQNSFDLWSHVYNYQRPHDALNGQTPSKRFELSSRIYTGKLEPVEYDTGEVVRKVHPSTGVFRYAGQRYRAGKGLGGEYIAIRETAQSDEYCIFFMDHMVKKFKLSEGL